tara:strand:+ start:5378 stop:5779 length:402 start_codon:yes stop_codon:yes gene_type:complete
MEALFGSSKSRSSRPRRVFELVNARGVDKGKTPGRKSSYGDNHTTIKQASSARSAAGRFGSAICEQKKKKKGGGGLHGICTLKVTVKDVAKQKDYKYKYSRRKYPGGGKKVKIGTKTVKYAYYTKIKSLKSKA